MVKEQNVQKSQEEMNRMREEGRRQNVERKASESRRQREASETRKVNKDKVLFLIRLF